MQTFKPFNEAIDQIRQRRRAGQGYGEIADALSGKYHTRTGSRARWNLARVWRVGKDFPAPLKATRANTHCTSR